MVDQRNSDSGLVKQRWWNSGTVEQRWWKSGTEMVDQCNNDGGTGE